MYAEPLTQTNHAWPIFGHFGIVHLLQRAVSPTGTGPRHAYLFLGPRHAGKTTLATIFARALLCTSPESRPCETCRACRLMQAGNHPDFRMVQPLDREGNVDRVNGMLRVDQATELVREATLSPVEGRYKVFLIQEMQTANDSFANKLLKTLEEPPAHVVLCLTAPDRAGLLPTIVSRCQVMELQLLGAALIENALKEHWQTDPERARLLAHLSSGRLGWAVEQLANDGTWQERTEQLHQLWELTRSGRLQRLAFAEKLSAKRDERQLFGMLELWTTWWRDVMLAQSGCIEACSNIDHQDQIMRQAEALSPVAVQRYIHTLKRIEGYLQHTTNTRMALEVLLLRLPRLNE